MSSIENITSTGKNCKEAILDIVNFVNELNGDNVYIQETKENDKIGYEVIILIGKKRRKLSCVCQCKENVHYGVLSCDLPTMI